PAGRLASLGKGGQHRQVHLGGGPGEPRGAAALVRVGACRLGRGLPGSGWVVPVSHRLGSRPGGRRRARPPRPARRTSPVPGATGPSARTARRGTTRPPAPDRGPRALSPPPPRPRTGPPTPPAFAR